jgi:hypothetical protein
VFDIVSTPPKEGCVAVTVTVVVQPQTVSLTVKLAGTLAVVTGPLTVSLGVQGW